MSGEAGCALFPKAAAGDFPATPAKVPRVYIKPKALDVLCTFEDLAPGAYAVSATHDANGNHVLDRNLFGVPTEPWGVSNNIRPTLGAPRFADAAFALKDGDHLRLDSRLDR